MQKLLNTLSKTSSTSIAPDTLPTARAAYLSSSAPNTMSSEAANDMRNQYCRRANEEGTNTWKGKLPSGCKSFREERGVFLA